MNLYLLPMLLLPGAEPNEPPKTPDGKESSARKFVLKVPIGKATTFVDGPVDEDGFIDYAAALNKRLRGNITPDKNACVLLWKVLGPKPEGGRGQPAEYFKLLGIAEPPEKGDYYYHMGRIVRDLKLQQNELAEVYDQQIRAGRRIWKVEEYPHIGAWLYRNDKALDLLVEATKRPEYFSPIAVHPMPDGKKGLLIGYLLPQVQRCRELVTALTARAMFRLGEGKEEAAWEDLQACHRLAWMTAQGSTLIELLVGIAIDSIACNSDLVYLEQVNLTSKQLRERLKTLQSLRPLRSTADSIDLGERFMGLDCLQAMQRGGLNLLQGVIDTPKKYDRETEVRMMAAVDWEPIYRGMNGWYDRLADAMRMKNRVDGEAKLDKLEQELADLKKTAPDFAKLLNDLEKAGAKPDKSMSKAMADRMALMLVPSLRKVHSARERSEQTRLNAQVAFALAAYRADHKRYPEKLDDLSPKYLAKVPGDLFGNRPLTYRPHEKGYLFYSFGVNGKDDLGRWYDDEPQGDDIRVHMPLPPLKPRQ